MDSDTDHFIRRPTIAVLLLTAALLGSYIIWSITYNLFFSPLRSYPGPKLWAVSNIPSALMNVSGKGSKLTRDLHIKYGPMVRIAPDWLDYSDPDAFQQIAGHRKLGAKVNEKDGDAFGPVRNTIIGATRHNHSRYRKKLASGFSAQAMRDQQPIIMKYVDLLIHRMRECSQGGSKPLDMTAWYNWITFDIIGDLTFGESFHGLENGAYHPWISLLFQSLKMVGIMGEVRRFRWLRPLLLLFLSSNARKKASEHHAMTAQKVKQRLEHETTRPDFMDAMIRENKTTDALSMDEINANASVLVTAGSETTASALAAMTYYLCRHPDILSKLQGEIRSAFQSEVEINFDSVGQLKYEFAVINETLRLFPPAPAHAVRVINEDGDSIMGRYVPPKTKVSINYWSMHHDPSHWELVEDFMPERWLGDSRFDNDNKSAFLPFSAGPRTCLGMNLAYAELRLIMTKIIWNFDMVISNDCENWVNDSKQYFNWEKKPLWVYFTPR